jgi:hypothetical protein
MNPSLERLGYCQRICRPDGAWFLAQRMGLESLGKRRKEFAKGEGSQSRASGCERVIGCRRQVRDLVFLVLVLQICRADGAGDERRAKIILRWTFGAFGV